MTLPVCHKCGSAGPWFSDDEQQLACCKCGAHQKKEQKMPKTTKKTTKKVAKKTVKKKAGKKKAPRRVQAQPQLEGMQDKKDPVLSKLGEAFEGARDAWVEAGIPMRATRAALMKKMIDKELEVYRDPETGLIVELETKEALKVRRDSEKE